MNVPDQGFFDRVAEFFKLQRLPFVTLAEAVRDVEKWLSFEGAAYNLTWLNPATLSEDQKDHRFHFVLTQNATKFKKIYRHRDLFIRLSESVYKSSIQGELERRCYKRVERGISRDSDEEEAVTFYTAIFQLIYSFVNPVSAIPGVLYKKKICTRNPVLAHVKDASDTRAGVLPLFDVYSFKNKREHLIKTNRSQFCNEDEVPTYDNESAYRWVEVIEGPDSIKKGNTKKVFNESWDIYIPINIYGRFLGYLIISNSNKDQALRHANSLQDDSDRLVRISEHLNRAYHRGMVGYILDGYRMSPGEEETVETDPVNYWQEQLCTWLYWEKLYLNSVERSEKAFIKSDTEVVLLPRNLKRMLQSSGGFGRSMQDSASSYQLKNLGGSALTFRIEESRNKDDSIGNYLDDRIADAVDLLSSLTNKWRAADQRVREEASAIQHEVKHVVRALTDRWMFEPDEIITGIKKSVDDVLQDEGHPLAGKRWKIAPVPSIYEEAARMLMLWTGTNRPWDVFGQDSAPGSLEELVRKSYEIAKANLHPYALSKWDLDRDYNLKKAVECRDLINKHWVLEVADKGRFSVPEPRFADSDDDVDRAEFKNWVDLTRLLVSCIGDALLHGDPLESIITELSTDSDNLHIVIRNVVFSEERLAADDAQKWEKLRSWVNSNSFSPFVSGFKGKRVIDIYASKLNGEVFRRPDETTSECYKQDIIIPLTVLS